MPAKKRTERGRPTDFRPEYCDQAERLCRLVDATDDVLADFFGKAVSTISRWKAQHPEFSEALKRGKLPSDVEVAGSMYKCANGFEYEEAHPIKLKDVIYENGKKIRETERVEIVMVKKIVPPQVMAGMYWLNNRQKLHWRQRHEVTGKDGAPLMPIEELMQVIDGKTRGIPTGG